MKIRTITQLKKDADKWFSQYIRNRDSYERNGERVADCITCGRTYPLAQLQTGHFVSRRVNALRYNEANCNVQCVGCNMFRSGEQFTHGLAIDKKYGDGTAAGLHARRFETHKLTRVELEQVIAEAKRCLEAA